jgi:hypothetical protein
VFARLAAIATILRMHDTPLTVTSHFHSWCGGSVSAPQCRRHILARFFFVGFFLPTFPHLRLQTIMSIIPISSLLITILLSTAANAQYVYRRKRRPVWLAGLFIGTFSPPPCPSSFLTDQHFFFFCTGLFALFLLLTLAMLARRRARRAVIAGRPPPSMMFTGPQRGRFGWGNNIPGHNQPQNQPPHGHQHGPLGGTGFTVSVE